METEPADRPRPTPMDMTRTEPHVPAPGHPDPMYDEALKRALPGLCLGIDTVQVSRVEASLHDFGDRFVQRLFTPHEIATCDATPARRTERLAARFAAKEAAIKAFDLAEAGVDWRHIEVRSDAAGRPTLALHGRALAGARARGAGAVAVSLSHDGDQACAVVAGWPQP